MQKIIMRKYIKRVTGAFNAAFVADIYTTAVPQGPSLPQANRSQLTRTYGGNQTLIVARLQGALDAVCHNSLNFTLLVM